jgi:hypothetical protein
MLKLSSEEQQFLLKKNKKEIDAYLPAVLALVNPLKTRSPLYAQLMKKEAEMQQPLCQVALGLHLHSNKKGYFAWNPAQLRDLILPTASEAEFITFLEAMSDCRAIEKKAVGKQFVGHLLF